VRKDRDPQKMVESLESSSSSDHGSKLDVRSRTGQVHRQGGDPVRGQRRLKTMTRTIKIEKKWYKPWRLKYMCVRLTLFGFGREIDVGDTIYIEW